MRAMTPIRDRARKSIPWSGVTVSLRMLVLIRWIAIIGQASTVVAVHWGMGLAFAAKTALVAVAASAALNVVATWSHRASARLGEREALLYLAYDTLQLGALLYLTGGLQNPFAILMLAPVTVSATILARMNVIALAALTVAAISTLARYHLPLPHPPGLPLEPQPLYTLGMWTALVFSTVFIAGYIWSVAEEARRMREAFAETQLALAREQRISAVGGLAAAAAHELGSPLGTIAVVAKELVRDLPPGSPFAEDAQLLLSQSERCRTILAELGTRRDGEGAGPLDVLPISAIVSAAGEPHRRLGIALRFTAAPGRDAAGGALPEPRVASRPEIMHGLGNLIQNAVQFARSEVRVTTSWSEETVAVDVIDDGPGFPQPVLARIGEPYISGRSGEAQHMGLGIFIAQSLLERTGARLDFANRADGGAEVMVEWRRNDLALSEPRAQVKETT
jgi:two-component system, sensor histidine kinase RegB